MEVLGVFAFFALIAWLARDLPPRPKAEPKRPICESAAPELGLTRRADSFVLQYEDDSELELRGAPEGSQLGERVTAEVRLAKPIATELRVVPNARQAPSAFRISSDFDRRYRVSTSRPDRARLLLRHRLRNELIIADTRGLVVKLDHQHVSVTGRWITQLEDVKRICNTAEELARQLITAERKLPKVIPWTRVAKAWRAAAGQLSAKLDDEAHAIAKDVGFARLWLHAGTELDAWFAELELVLARPLPARFELSNEAARTLWQRMTVKDMELGDQPFDEAYFISTEEPDAVRALFDPDLRKVLVELEQRTSSISITDKQIQGRLEGASVLKAERLVEALHAAIGAADALARRASPSGKSAYR